MMRSSILHSLSSILYPLSSRQRALAFLAFCAVLLLASCGSNMRDQPKCQPLEGSSFFADGKCARDLPPNTVARGSLQADLPQAAAGAGGATSAAAAGPTAATAGATAGPTAAPAGATAATSNAQQTQDF